MHPNERPGDPAIAAMHPDGDAAAAAGNYSTKTITSGLPAGSKMPRVIHVTLVRPRG